MIAKKITKLKELITIENAKDSFSMINTFALSFTEDSVSKTINSIRKFQDKTDNLLKKGLEINQKNQNLVFDTLDTVKESLMKIVKK